MKNSVEILGSKIKKASVGIKKLNEKAVIPSYGSEFAAGADLYACTDGVTEIKPHQTVMVPTGIGPSGEPCVGFIYCPWNRSRPPRATFRKVRPFL